MYETTLIQTIVCMYEYRDISWNQVGFVVSWWICLAEGIYWLFRSGLRLSFYPNLWFIGIVY